MGIVDEKKNSENQVLSFKVAYATAASDASQKIVRIPIHNHRSHFDDFDDERHRHKPKIHFDNAWSLSKINSISFENAERNGHPGTNAAPRDVKPRNIRPILRRVPMTEPRLVSTAKIDKLELVLVSTNLTGEDLKYLTKYRTQTSKEQCAGWLASYLSPHPCPILEHRYMLLGASSLCHKAIQPRMLVDYSWPTTTWSTELSPTQAWM
jgi:hypothetical protein